jgi:homoserine O-succinyltransferase
MSCARPGRDDAIVIGLVNAMPAAAMRSAERQFRSLLEARSGPGAIRLRLFALTDNDARPDHYEHLDALWNTRIDGLIVTGTEPRAADIARESCWPAMARVIDWADRNTISTIWSCFAAHAAVFRRDGIRRTTLPRKLSGVFTCAKSADHPLTANAPAEWTVPHSRYNTLDERDLLDAGYETLSRSPLVGADMFCRRGKKSLFLMLTCFGFFPGSGIATPIHPKIFFVRTVSPRSNICANRRCAGRTKT